MSWEIVGVDVDVCVPKSHFPSPLSQSENPDTTRFSIVFPFRSQNTQSHGREAEDGLS